MAEKRFIIEVRSKGFSRATRDFKTLEKNTKSYEKATDRMRGSTNGLQGAIGSLRNRILVYTFAIGGAVTAMNKFVSAASGFQDVKTRLVGLTGSVDEASKAFEVFNQVAATTPFQLQDVVNAGAQLEAFGVDSKATLSAVTDLAAFMGTSATEAASALGRAFAGGAGAADILRERGILQLIKDSQGIQDLTDLTLPQFRKALLSAMIDPVAGIEGSADRLSKTFTGAVSNMNDAVTRFAAKIGDMMIPSLTSAAQATETFFRTIDVQRLFQMGTAMTLVTGALVAYRNRMIAVNAVTALFALKLKTIVIAFGALVAAFSLDKFLQMQNAFKGLNNTTKSLTGNTNKLTNATQNYINTLNNSTSALMINAEAQERIDTLMADTVLLTMQNNDVDTKRIKIAQAIFRAEQNLSDAMKGKLVFDREAAVMGELVINASGLKTEAEIKEAEAIMRKTQAQVDAINKGNEVISVNSKITGSLQQMTNAMRRMSEGTMNTKQALGAFLRIAAQLMAISDPTGGALLSVGAGFFAHTGGLVRNNGIQRFAQGGVVQGQDNVPIMAQAGEFVMRREAVQNIGVQNLAQMNRTGDAGGVTVNISAPLVDETVIDHIIPAINKATNRNLA
jgi:hypothetical protein